MRHISLKFVTVIRQPVFDEFQLTIIDSVAEENIKNQSGLSDVRTEDKDCGSDDSELLSDTQSVELKQPKEQR